MGTLAHSYPDRIILRFRTSGVTFVKFWKGVSLIPIAFAVAYRLLKKTRSRAPRSAHP
jgi:hypothetical protein